MQNGCTRSWQVSIGLISFIFGVLVSLYTADFWWLSSWSLLLGFLVLVIFQNKSSLEKLGVAFIIALCLFWGGKLAVDLSQPQFDSVKHLPDVQTAIEGRVRSVQDRGNRSQIILEDIYFGEEQRSDFILVFSDSSWVVGERVRVRCNLSNPEPFDGFRYDRFLASRGVYKLCRPLGEPEIIGHEIVLRSIFSEMRTDIIKSVRARFSEPNSTLMLGLMLGESGFSLYWRDVFSRVGISHIVAASGYNVALITSILFGFLTWIGIKRQDAFSVLVLCIIGYMFLAGLSSSVIRAGIMGGLVLMSKQIGRKTTMRNIVLLTVAGMVAFNPLILVADVGFQLSVTATMGLIWLTPAIKKRLMFLPKNFSIRDSLTATVAATLATTPVALNTFGQISLVGPIANLFILPFVPITSGFTILSLFFEPGSIFSGPAWLVSEIILNISNELSKLPFAIIEANSWRAYIISALSVLLIILCWLVSSKKSSSSSAL